MIDIHTHILILGPVAAHSQYLFGLKVNALITSPPSNVYKCFPSFKSHNMTCPSWKLYNLDKLKYDFNYLWSHGQMVKKKKKWFKQIYYSLDTSRSDFPTTFLGQNIGPNPNVKKAFFSPPISWGKIQYCVVIKLFVKIVNESFFKWKSNIFTFIT